MCQRRNREAPVARKQSKGAFCAQPEARFPSFRRHSAADWAGPAGYWAADVDRHRRVVFRYEVGDAYGIDYPGYHRIDMHKSALKPMRNPPHPGLVVQELGFAEGTQRAEMIERIGLDRAEIDPVLDGEAPLTASVAIALEDAGISYAAYWLRMQSIYDLAQERLRRERESATAAASSGSAAVPRDVTSTTEADPPTAG